ncbi:hypothetical protein BD626DRAFT_572359 [Schizophyllum amplum]|uniref:Uncharacterized protein n=1 Tax=Schizophyllum amplum TaxID=97359 RepID=A0A550C4E0_9AGAR|nr:hypothetical protein BD626DRAFT_572359 [Auriculariopsis ampla]
MSSRNLVLGIDAIPTLRARTSRPKTAQPFSVSMHDFRSTPQFFARVRLRGCMILEQPLSPIDDEHKLGGDRVWRGRVTYTPHTTIYGAGTGASGAGRADKGLHLCDVPQHASAVNLPPSSSTRIYNGSERASSLPASSAVMGQTLRSSRVDRPSSTPRNRPSAWDDSLSYDLSPVVKSILDDRRSGKLMQSSFDLPSPFASS